jgi:hypothetical protein
MKDNSVQPFVSILMTLMLALTFMQGPFSISMSMRKTIGTSTDSSILTFTTSTEPVQKPRSAASTRMIDRIGGAASARYGCYRRPDYLNHLDATLAAGSLRMGI